MLLGTGYKIIGKFKISPKYTQIITYNPNKIKCIKVSTVVKKETALIRNPIKVAEGTDYRIILEELEFAINKLR